MPPRYCKGAVSVTRFSVFKNGLLEKIFGSKREEVTGQWRKHREDSRFVLHIQYLGDKIKENEMARHVVHVGAKRNSYGVLVGKPEGKRSSGRQRHRWAHNIKMIFKKYNGMAWTKSD